MANFFCCRSIKNKEPSVHNEVLPIDCKSINKHCLQLNYILSCKASFGFSLN